MIVKFKIFENQDAKNYTGKFFISPVFMSEYDWKKESFYIVLVKDIDFNHNGKIWPIADNYTVMKNGDIKDPGGWGHYYTEEEFNKIEFMTPIEFYEKYPELCQKLFDKVYNDYNGRNINQYDWYGKMLIKYKNALETIPQLRYYVDSKKYNL